MRPWAALALWAALWAGGARAQWPCSFNSLCRCRPSQISCVAVPLHKLPELSSAGLMHLEVTGTGLQGVESGALDALRLQSLVLSDNRLQSLPDRALNSMALTLSSLDFGYNEFPDIPFNSLKVLKILNWLNLQNNNIVDIVGDWAHLRDSLTSLILTGNSITDIPSDGLHQLRHLNKLDLDSNKITSIAKMSLPSSLKILNLADNLLEKFPVDLFPNLQHLQSLNLRGNLIQRISHITFKNHRNMDKLELGDNGLEMWPSNLFNNTLVVRHLSLELNQLKLIPANAFKGMHTVKLILSYNKIEHIDEDAFHGLEHTLEQLDLEHNHLSSIPRAVLNLKRLKHLYLPSNKIANIHFLPHHIKVLSLNGNLLTSIPRDALRNCSLTDLDMGYNLIAYLEEGDFDQWGDSVRTLYLRSNKITRLDAGVFSSLPQLKELSLSFNDIHFVHPEVFVNMSQTLRILEMSLSMYRDDFPEDVLQHLTSLEWLSLDNNNVQSLSVQSLFHLQKLQYLNLEFNRITNIPVGFFDVYKFENVREVYLSYNLLEIIDSETFFALPELHILDLTVNRIRNISSSSFHNMPKLMHIALFDNLVTDIGENAFHDLPSLFKLELQKNQLKEFSLKVFQNATDFEIPFLLNISRNQIILLDGSGPEIFIDTLDTAHNRLADTPTSFLSKIAKRLKRCILSYNEIGHLDTNSFENLDVLEILNLDHNYISTIRRRAFLGLKQLQILDLSHNRIEQLSVEQFSNLNHLRFLNLRRNHIRTLPRDVFKNTMIEHLDLSINEFIILPSMAFSQVGFSLRYLDISHNSIESVDSTLFQETQFLLSLDLSNNRLTILSDNLFNSLGNLQNLDVSSNSVRANFKELLHYLPVLKYLSLSNTGLKVFPFIPLRNLTSLNLTFNFIEHAKEIAVKNMGALRYLYLKGNSLTSVPGHIWPHTPNLKVLDLSKNPVQSLNENSFHGLDKLETLDISNLHKLKHFDPGTLSSLKSLSSLRIELRHNIKDFHLGNIIAEVLGLKGLHIHMKEDSLEYQLNGVFVPKLRELEISGEDLKRISTEAFEGAERLYELSVQIHDTAIKELPVGLLEDLGRVSQLSLDLSRNHLTSLSPATFYPNSSTWEKLATKLIAGGLSVSENPLPCDCGVAWLARWVRRWAREAGVAGRLPPPAECSRSGPHHSGAPYSSSRLLRLYPEDLRCHASALAAAAPVPAKHTSTTVLAVLSSLILAKAIGPMTEFAPIIYIQSCLHTMAKYFLIS